MDCYILSDLSLAKIEIDGIKNIFRNVFDITPISNKESKVKAVYDCYGVNNELFNVLKVIEDNSYSLSDCEIVYTNDIYENSVRGLFDSKGISYSISSIHAKSTNLVSFMLDVIAYVESDYKYELLEKVLKNQGLEKKLINEFKSTLYFPKVIVGFGYDRTKLLLDDIKDEAKKRNICAFISDLLEAFDKDGNVCFDKFLSFTKKYIKSKNEKLALMDKIANISYILNYVDDNKLEIIKKELSSLRYSEADEDGGILVSGINRSFSIRKHLFIIGLSQTYLNKYDNENPFITDVEEYDKEFKGLDNIHIIKYLKEDIKKDLDYYIDNSCCDIYLSYSSFNKIDMRSSAKSVYLINKTSGIDPIKINLYDKYINDLRMVSSHTGKKQEDDTEDFDNGVVKPELEHLDEVEAANEAEAPEPKPDVFTLSPSAMKNLIECPLKYYYGEIADISDVTYQKLEPVAWLEPNAKGTFFHEVLQNYANRALKKENFIDHLDMDIFEEEFAKALENAEKQNADRNLEAKNDEVEEIRQVAMEYIKRAINDNFLNTPYRVLETEYRLLDKDKGIYSRYEKNNRIVFSGFVDRVDGYVMGNTLHLRIVDYKSGKYTPKNKQKYIQHILYPYALTQLYKNKYDAVIVDKFIYDYPFENQKNEYEPFELIDQAIFDRIDKLITPYVLDKKGIFDNFYKETNIIENDLSKNNGTFCEYCSFKDVCIKRVKEGYNVKKQW
ncbi:MAG: PD-(D/E)XK nuclease family protein [bacterium]|nr:PD-(D/E)XK nuclease family protein [bacterium]